MSKEHLKTLKAVVDLPTAPFVEGHVAEYIRQFVASRRSLRLRSDRFGNLLIKYSPRGKVKGGRKSRPILFAAHMDHPGFIAEKMLDGGRVQAEWRGGVQGRYFAKEKIRFYSGGRWVSGTIEKVIPQKAGKGSRRGKAAGKAAAGDAPPKAIVARVKGAMAIGSPGMWACGDAKIWGGRLHCRASDDLSGVASILCTLDEIDRRGVRCPCYAFFTRAEEVGFAGALAAVEGKTIPEKVIVVAVENSKALPGVSLGGGPVLRVGDKATVFTPAATAYCQVVAEKLAKEDKRFRFQRKLMDGGTCESTAYCHYGYEATGICLPMVNYHNMDTERKKIAPEAVDVRDFLNLVRWFAALAESPIKMEFDGGRSGLGKRLDGLRRKYSRRLERSPQISQIAQK